MRELLTDAVPDLVAFVRPDGVVLDHLGGSGRFLRHRARAVRGEPLDAIWPDPLARGIRQTIRGVFATREAAVAEFRDGEHSVEIRVVPHGRRRALVIVRESGGGRPPGLRAPGTGTAASHRIERRGFLRRFQLTIADASLRSMPLAVCMIRLGGLQAITEALGFQIAERVSTLALDRLRKSVADGAGDAPWQVGQLGEGLLAGVIEGIQDRDTVRDLVTGWCRALGEELRLGDAAFVLVPRAGIAMLGPDASRPQRLLEQARAAMNEARRSDETVAAMYSDGLKLRPLAGLAAERELREAIEAGQFRLAYLAAGDLDSGRLAAVHTELRWMHPERGELRGQQFLPLAHHTGALPALARWTFGRLREDLPAILAHAEGDVRVSIVASRQHLVGGGLQEDLEAVLDSGAVPSGQLELRIADRTLAGLAAPRRTLEPLAALGVGLLVDEYGHSFSSLARLAELPLRGLVIDRRTVARLGGDPAATAIARAAIGVAQSFGLRRIAAGVASSRQRELLERLGCQEAFGDCFGELSVEGAADPGNRADLP